MDPVASSSIEQAEVPSATSAKTGHGFLEAWLLGEVGRSFGRTRNSWEEEISAKDSKKKGQGISDARWAFQQESEKIILNQEPIFSIPTPPNSTYPTHNIPIYPKIKAKPI